MKELKELGVVLLNKYNQLKIDSKASGVSDVREIAILGERKGVGDTLFIIKNMINSLDYGRVKRFNRERDR